MCRVERASVRQTAKLKLCDSGICRTGSDPASYLIGISFLLLKSREVFYWLFGFVSLGVEP